MKNKKTWIISAIAIMIVAAIMFNTLKPAPYYPDINSSRPVLGNPNAKIKVVEFSDLECPACKLAANYPQRLINEFGEDISVEFKHFPLTTIHRYAYKAAEAAECANDQGRFWEYIDIAYKNQPELSASSLKFYAKNLGLNTTSFNACLDSGAKKDIVDEFMRQGYALDVPGTPTFFVNGKMITTIRYEDITAEVRDQLTN